MSNYRTRTCRECAVQFQGGPRAWYCPCCRKARQQQINRESKMRRRSGKTRQIGSIDFCVTCKEPYIVYGSNQRYCKKCAPFEIKKVAAKQSLEYYRQEKETINPKRYLHRKKEISTCAMCGKEFPTCGPTKYCSDECRDKAYRFRRAIYDAKRRGCQVPIVPSENRHIDWSGVDWSKPLKTISEETGYKYHTVVAARRRVIGASKKGRLDWSGVDWSKPLREIAKETGRNYKGVVSARRRLTRKKTKE